jgi:Iap family predicted aminopeptidase
MNGEEERSYIKTIKYFREKEHKKKSFKLAEMYVSTWLERNDSLEKLEEGVYDEIR